jgi:hypothetical protein
MHLCVRWKSHPLLYFTEIAGEEEVKSMLETMTAAFS